MASSSPSNPAVQHESPSQPDPQNLLHEAFKALKSAQRAAFEEQLAKPRPKFATGGCLCGAVRYRVLFKEGHDFWENVSFIFFGTCYLLSLVSGRCRNGVLGSIGGEL
jgi:hypothetical protein